MKINVLLANPAGVRSGYINVDPFAVEGSGLTRCEPFNLSPLCDAGELTELVVHDLLDRSLPHQADGILSHWVSLLAHGGTLTLSVVDLMEVAKGLVNRVLSPPQAVALLHGEQQEAWDTRRGNFTLSQLVEVVKSKGLRILKKRVVNFRAVVVAQRP